MGRQFRFPIYSDEAGVFAFAEKTNTKEMKSVQTWQKEQNEEPAVYHRKTFIRKTMKAPHTGQKLETKAERITMDPGTSYTEEILDEVSEINMSVKQRRVQQQLNNVQKQVLAKQKEKKAQEAATSVVAMTKDEVKKNEPAFQSEYARFANRAVQAEPEASEQQSKMKESMQRLQATRRETVPFCRKQAWKKEKDRE